jgi:hypothetical protein
MCMATRLALFFFNGIQKFAFDPLVVSNRGVHERYALGGGTVVIRSVVFLVLSSRSITDMSS